MFKQVSAVTLDETYSMYVKNNELLTEFKNLTFSQVAQHFHLLILTLIPGKLSVLLVTRNSLQYTSLLQFGTQQLYVC